MEIYEPQERAFATGIIGNWPTVIKHPNSPHGRLVKRSLEDIKLFKAYKLAFTLLNLKQKQSIIKAIKQLHDGESLSSAIEVDLLKLECVK